LLKPRSGRGSVGVLRIDTKERFESARNSLGAYVAQEPCVSPEVTIDAFRGRDGKSFRAVARERLEVKAGVCTKARLFEDDELASIAERIGDGLDLTGTYCVQVMRSAESGRWLVTDVNPRPGA